MNRPEIFSPDWGSESRQLWSVVLAARNGSLRSKLSSLLAQLDIDHCNADQLRVGFSTSLLLDVLDAGGQAWVSDSRLFVSWPDWNGDVGRDAIKRAMHSARDLRPLTEREIERILPLFAGDIDGDTVARVLEHGTFRLVSVDNSHPTGIPYKKAFAAALRYWSMPYRGRTGRMRRFVMTAQHPDLGRHPKIAGILELGDEAPFCRWRDDLLGLSPSSFKDWLRAQKTSSRFKEIAGASAERLRSIRSCLLPTNDGRNLARLSAKSILARQEEIEQAARGRSLVAEHELDGLRDRKRLSYGVRLARGEAALLRLAHQGPELLLSSWDVELDRDLGAGVRALHDILVPRLHLEATICGAVPPFSEALGGKLLISFFTHPAIIQAPLHGERKLLGWSFDLTKLDRHLPNHGMLCLTTKGLYQGHAPMYNRSAAPGQSSAIRMRHLGNTGGHTTTLLSNRTAKFAWRFLDAIESVDQRVSTVYGSGGSKRHRAIESAAVLVGISKSLTMAGIQRPVYGMEFVHNAIEVCWLGSEPNWRVEHYDDEDAFCTAATAFWRDRWLQRAAARIHEFAIAPSFGGELNQQLNHAGKHRELVDT